MPSGVRTLFLAIKPPSAVAAAIDDIRQSLGIDGSYAQSLFHITLYVFGNLAELDSAIIDRAIAGAASLRCAPFRVVFDRVESNFLRASEPIRGLAAFQHALMRVLADHRAVERAYKFRPHITLAYGEHVSRSVAIDGISWLVEEFELIESVHGEAQHIERGCWRLRG